MMRMPFVPFLVLLLRLAPGALAEPPAGEPPADDSCAADTSLVDAILEEALSFLGTPYVYGGTGPDGFDCSGLVYRVFGDHGVELPRTAGGMETMGTAVERDELEPGDLLIFDDPKHVGIYLGDGSFIHSSSWEDRGVVITPLDQENYVRRYRCARRVLQVRIAS